MDKINLIELGAYVFPRMSIMAQRVLYEGAKENGRFSEMILKELATIDKGKDFIKLCDSRLDFNELVYVLACCDNNTVKRLTDLVNKEETKGRFDIKTALKGVNGENYLLEKVEIALHVPSVEETEEWYKKILGWKGDLVDYDEHGRCTYGCMYMDDVDGLIKGSRIFNGIHLRREEDTQVAGVSLWIHIDDLDCVRDRILESGWDKVSEIQEMPWRARIMYVTDTNGYRLMFIQWL